MAETNIKFTQDDDGIITVPEMVFFRYLNELRGMLAELIVVEENMFSLMQSMKAGNIPSETDLCNIVNFNDRFNKTRNRVIKFNSFMKAYENDRFVAYDFFMNTENNK